MKRPTGLIAFMVIMVGQIISLVATNMTGFALPIWIYQKTASATSLSLLGFFYIAPMLAISPFAGVLVDRYNRKLMMALGDTAAGLATTAVLILFVSGRLEIWHLYISNFFTGLFSAFHFPAFSAAITMIVSKEQYGRANGLMSLSEIGPGVIAPFLAAALLGTVGLQGILLIDVITFVVAVAMILAVDIPQPKRTAEGLKAQGSIFKEAAYGFEYILARPSLLGLQLVFMLGNFLITIPTVIQPALILARTGNNAQVLALVSTLGAVGGISGGVLMSIWGGPRPRVNGVLIGWLLSGLFGVALMGFGRSALVWGSASFFGAFLIPIVNGSNQAIWQAKVAPDLQGRVFSIRKLIAWFVLPLCALIAGPLADRVFEPAMLPGGGMASLLGKIFGTGPGAGIAILFVAGGVLASGVGLAGYAVRVIRNAESILPDHDETTSDEPDALTNAMTGSADTALTDAGG